MKKTTYRYIWWSSIFFFFFTNLIKNFTLYHMITMVKYENVINIVYLQTEGATLWKKETNLLRLVSNDRNFPWRWAIAWRDTISLY